MRWAATEEPTLEWVLIWSHTSFSIRPVRLAESWPCDKGAFWIPLYSDAEHLQSRECFYVYLLSFSVGRTERSALRALRKQLYAHKSDLISAFQEFDPNNTGTLKRNRTAMHWNCIFTKLYTIKAFHHSLEVVMLESNCICLKAAFVNNSTATWCLCLRDDLSKSVGQCHREYTEVGSALEGAAISARQQHAEWHDGLPEVDKGVLHHWAKAGGGSLFPALSWYSPITI